jgi:phosphoserine phosphatase
MTHVLTLVAARDGGLSEGDAPGGPVRWVVPGRVAEVEIAAPPPRAFLDDLRARLDGVDVFATPRAGRAKRLLIADMDATIVEGETLDELAARAGIGEKVAAITARAMAGELDFRAALAERVGLLAGLPESALADTLAAMRLTPGAGELVAGMRAAGATCVLVSGGFTFFTGAVARRCGFHAHHGNVLEVRDGVLTGRVAEPVLDKDTKLTLLTQYVADLGLAPADVLAIGDGANDIPMLRAAGLGIGFRPKPAVAAAVDAHIVHGDLTAALYAQGLGPEGVSYVA